MLNQITVQIRLVRDCEMNFLPNNGTPVAKFTGACDRDFKNKQGEKETDFFNCVWFGKGAEAMSKYLTKGRMFVVTGRLQIRVHEKDGQKRYYTEINVEKVHFCDSPKDKPSQRELPGTPANIDDDDSIPF